MQEELTKEKILALLKAEMPRLRQEYGVEQLALYGSFAQGQQKKKSDLCQSFQDKTVQSVDKTIRK